MPYDRLVNEWRAFNYLYLVVYPPERELEPPQYDDFSMITVVIPVYNEEPNLVPLHAKLDEALKRLDRSAEIVYVDDGSTDGSLNILREIAEVDADSCGHADFMPGQVEVRFAPEPGLQFTAVFTRTNNLFEGSDVRIQGVPKGQVLKLTPKGADVVAVTIDNPNLAVLPGNGDGTFAGTILEPLGLNLVRARSGNEALKCLLRDDFAVVL